MGQCNIAHAKVDADVIAAAFNGHTDAAFAAAFDTKLAAVLTPEQLTALDSIKSQIKASVSASDVSSAEDAANASTADALESSLKSAALANASEAALAESQGMVEAHDVFNAEVALSFPEPVFSEAKYTSPVDIQDVNYTLKEDYPHSYGSIDEVGNWWKVNKKKGIIEFVHKSGTFIQIDDAGNLTQHITGNKKEVIRGDYSLEVYGNRDTLIHKKDYTHVDEDVTVLINGNFEETIDGTETRTVAGDVSWSFSANLTASIGGNTAWESGGNADFKSGGPFTVNGATINLN